MKRVTRAIPGNYDDLAIGGLMSVGSGIATLLTTGNFAQAAEAALTNAVDYGTGDLDGGNLQDGTLSGVEAKAQQDPAFLGRQGPAVPPPTATQMPDRRTQAARRQQLTTAHLNRNCTNRKLHLRHHICRVVVAEDLMHNNGDVDVDD